MNDICRSRSTANRLTDYCLRNWIRNREAFFSYDWEGTALAEEFGRNGEDQFIEITFQDDWAVIRTIDEANGVVYACE